MRSVLRAKCKMCGEVIEAEYYPSKDRSIIGSEYQYHSLEYGVIESSVELKCPHCGSTTIYVQDWYMGIIEFSVEEVVE